MHSAPAVSFPVGRSRFQGWTIAWVSLGSAVVGLTWSANLPELGWRQALFTLIYLVSSGLATALWRRTPAGTLRWDGMTWTWKSDKAMVTGALTVHLDFQFVLLLSLRPATGGRRWLWPERRWAKMDWHDLRRAVFSHKGTAQQTDVPAGTPLRQEAA
jgi:hypothetical protein